MLSRLVPLILFIVANTHAAELSWKRLLHYRGDHSNASEKEFFVSKTGNIDPDRELHESLIAIQEKKKVGKQQKLFACAFPARYKYLQRTHSNFQDVKCPELDQWLKDFAASKVYLVYSSAYPNNPASVFGHTFLRFDRDVGNIDSDLRGYSVAFMATTNPNDNPMLYTFNGLTGGYDGHLNIKPFYQSVGLYNNSESRDLWEYQIPFSKKEIHFLVLHLWEFMQNTGFPYYFFDDNCSWMMLKLLEIVRNDLSFKSKNGLFVIPQETVVEVIETFKIKKHKVRSSLGRQIDNLFAELNLKEQYYFKKALSDIDNLHKIKSYKELKLLAYQWKLKNYKKQTLLDPQSKKLFMETHRMLSKVPKGNYKERLDTQLQEQALELSHKSHLATIFIAPGFSTLSFRYGLHDIHDRSAGYPKNAVINFGKIDFLYNQNKVGIHQLEIVDIKSLENFRLFYPRISWFANFKFADLKNKHLPQSPIISGGGGFTKRYSRFEIFFMPGLTYYRSLFRGKLRVGGKIGPFTGEYHKVLHSSALADHYQLGLRINPSKNIGTDLEYRKLIGSKEKQLGLRLKLFL